MGDFQAEEFGKGRLLVGRFVHLGRSQPSLEITKARTLRSAPLLRNL
jgi:hypothetical protein